MADKLKVYNTALRYCKERNLGSLTEEREPRRLLDDSWGNGAVNACLEAAQWKFAVRTVQLDYDTSIDVEFGLRRAFPKPDDWVKTVAVCSDEYFDTPLLRYAHENNYWYADIDIIYVKFISNLTAYGNDLSLWPQSFSNYVSAYLANDIVGKLTHDEGTIQRVERQFETNKKSAKGKDAWNQPTSFPAPGAWATSRGRGGSSRGRDRGNRNQLLG